MTELNCLQWKKIKTDVPPRDTKDHKNSVAVIHHHFCICTFFAHFNILSPVSQWFFFFSYNDWKLAVNHLIIDEFSEVALLVYSLLEIKTKRKPWCASCSSVCLSGRKSESAEGKAKRYAVCHTLCETVTLREEKERGQKGKEHSHRNTQRETVMSTHVTARTEASGRARVPIRPRTHRFVHKQERTTKPTPQA